VSWCHKTFPVVVAMLVMVVTVAAPASVAGAEPTSTVPYYLALGDSLSQGVQPNAAGRSVETRQGYADDLWARYHASFPQLRLAKLGCPGETTGSMITGGICPYSLTSQLAQATAFLTTHRVVLVTLDIGANNVDGCVSAAGLNLACLGAGIDAATHDLPVILTALRQAAPTVRMVGMTYYDPFVAAALKGGAFAALAIESEGLAASFNQMLTRTYATRAFSVADVGAAFSPLNIVALPALDLPVDLAVICVFTWMCAPAPVGPNIHATAAGYAYIAGVFSRKISG
jgi:lysophospholipase L1-like esterase